MLAFVAKHHIAVRTNVYHGLQEIPRLVADASRGNLKARVLLLLISIVARFACLV
jgi:hypothetical protein